MRVYVIALRLLSAFLAIEQDGFDTHGKTEGDILKMGMQEWSEFYAAKEGASTAAMTQAADIYGQVAKKRNVRILDGLDGIVKERTLKLRRLLGIYASSSVDVAYAESGGGTMYNTMWASVSGVVEDTLYLLI